MITREAARKKLKLNKDDILILSVGGSGGAKRINEIAISLMNNYNKNKEKIKHIHSAGYSYYSYLTKNNPKLINTENTRIVPFIENMPIYLKASDIVITRCGSATLAEIEKCKCTPILIPSPNVASNHQLKNAKEYLKNNVGFLIEEKDVTQSKLIELIETIIKNKKSSDNKNNTRKEDAAYIAAESIINMMRQLD
jgi:UDP-N-acetylglucosamine--N-acetylmuramyl-(pentapeptide) pyrophosphoryl-undecaprenol N-acetylglucosamine transferase